MAPETKSLATTRSVDGEKLTTVQRLGGLLAASGYFADARDMAQAAVKVMAGEELGIPPVASMMGIHIIKGKVVLSANLIASRIKAHGYDYVFEQFDATVCKIDFLSRIEDGKRRVLGKSSFSIQDAKQAKIELAMYEKYPRNMLFSRAISNGARWFCPDIFSGVPVYSPDEFGVVTDQDGEIPHSEPSTPSVPGVIESIEVKATARESTFAEKLARYTEQKKRVGEKAYYRVLGGLGYEHANEVVKRPVAERQIVYSALMALPDEADTEQDDPGGDE